MEIYIVRNSQTYGPYNIYDVRRYVEHGTFLQCDIAYAAGQPQRRETVGYYLKKQKLKVKVEHEGGFLRQLRKIGRRMVLPFDALLSKEWSSDRNLLLLALVGLLPLALGTMLGTGVLMFYAISLYFAAIWALFFYSFFKTSQVKLRTSLTIFFLTQACVFLIFGLAINYLNPFYWLEDGTGFTARLLFFVLAVGLTEELVKSIPLYIVAKRAKQPLIPQTLVYYGLISGVAFGVFEGVEYQLGVNATMEYGEGFFSNIARLTSLPFLHAIWCGIAGYFIAFSKLYPKYRKSLCFLALAIPALLHGLYDTFCTSLGLVGLAIAIAIGVVSVVLLMTYLKKGTSNKALFK